MKIKDLPDLQKQSYEQRFYWREETTQKTMEKTMEKTREKIISLIKNNPNITTGELAEDTSLTIKGVEWQLKKLKDEDKIKRVGPDKGGYWEVL